MGDRCSCLRGGNPAQHSKNQDGDTVNEKKQTSTPNQEKQIPNQKKKKPNQKKKKPKKSKPTNPRVQRNNGIAQFECMLISIVGCILTACFFFDSFTRLYFMM